MSAQGLRRAADQVGRRLLFIGLPVVLVLAYGHIFITRGPNRSDYWTFWLAGRTVLHGGDPYPAIAALPHVASAWFAPFVYPPVAAFLLAPVAVLPFMLAKIVYFALNLVALGVALRLLGVRDRRCYSLALISPPAIEAAGIGTISIPLLLCIAAAWRYRVHAVRLGLLVACAMTAKLFLWPVWFWLLRTRRWRAAIVAACASVVAVLVSWALIGFAGLRDYPTLLSRMTGLEGPNSYSPYALARVLGAGDGHAARLATVLGLIGLVLALRFVRGDERLLVALLGVAFVATPILWPHYLVLLFVPIALASRSLSRLWFAPVALWADATAWSHHSAWRIVGELAVCTIVIGSFLREERSPAAVEIPPGVVLG